RPHARGDPRGHPDERLGEDVGDDEVEAPLARVEVAGDDLDRPAHAVQGDVLGGHGGGDRVDVGGEHARGAEPGGGDREDARPGAEVEHDLAGGRPGGEGGEAETGGGVG